VPYTVFIDPQLGRVGMSETEAKESGRNIQVAKMPMDYVARALEVDESRGFMKAVVDADTAQILGCAILGIEGGEIMAMLEIAMMGKVPYTVLRDAVFEHPTLAESLNNLLKTFFFNYRLSTHTNWSTITFSFSLLISNESYWVLPLDMHHGSFLRMPRGTILYTENILEILVFEPGAPIFISFLVHPPLESPPRVAPQD
jgi:hypothetical protein